jgi:cytohesin
MYGQNETLAVLLDKGADLESKTWDKRTPLHVAAQQGHKVTVEFLLKKGADLNARTTADTFGPQKQTPLQLALAAGRVEVVRFLVEKGAQPKLEGEVEKRWQNDAANRKDVAMLRYFVERGLAVDAAIGSPQTDALHVAAERGDLDALKAFAAKGADLKKKDAIGRTLLNAAVLGHQKAAVAYLLEQGADVKDAGAIQNAVYQGDKEIVELLLAKGADVNHKDGAFGNSLLATAVHGNQPDVLQLLLAKGADAKNDPVALHAAALLGRKPLAEKLLAAGADPNAAPAVQRGMGTGFHLYYFRLEKRPDVLAFLLPPEVPRPPQQWGDLQLGTPLHAALAGRQKDVAELLLAKGAKADAKFPDGSPPLHLAAYLGDVALVKLLLANKADVNAKDAAGATALKVAEDEGRKDVAELLRKQGAKE